MPWAPKKRTREWRQVDQRRQSAAERGYDHRWEDASLAYRRANPLCVHCLLQGRVKPSQCVDHIAPIACCPELQWEELNWAALCTSCHSYKTAKEPRAPWPVNSERVVVCGLPGTGKSTWAKKRKAPRFDADELGLTMPAEIIRARTRFIRETEGPCIVIVASTITAALVVAELRGTLRHMTRVYRDKPVRNRMG